MKLNKIISFALCISLVFSLAACGKSTSNSTSKTYDPDAASTKASETTTIDSNSVKVTIPEGYTLLKIAWLLNDNGVCTTDAFLSAASNYDLSSYSVLSSLQSAQNVCFNLEGYLFPATYTFQKGEDPKDVIDTMVSASDSRFTADMRQRAAELGYSVHQILTVASIIEKEAYTSEQRTLIASTIYNRLNKGMKLQCDVTTKYCTGVIQVQYPDKIDFYKYYYNTYRCAALPAGPICNPGMESINAALYPDTTDYLYFVINTEPPYESAFAATYDEHLANCDRLGVTQAQ